MDDCARYEGARGDPHPWTRHEQSIRHHQPTTIGWWGPTPHHKLYVTMLMNLIRDILFDKVSFSWKSKKSLLLGLTMSLFYEYISNWPIWPVSSAEPSGGLQNQNQASFKCCYTFFSWIERQILMNKTEGERSSLEKKDYKSCFTRKPKRMCIHETSTHTTKKSSSHR